MEHDVALLTDPGLIQARQAAFQALRPACTPLLALRSDATGLAAALRELRRVVEAQDAGGLRGCWDYVMFPLFIMLDAAAELRRPAGGGSSGSSGGSTSGPQPQHQPQRAMDAAAVPAARSDAVLEALLACLLAMLQRAGCSSDDQLMSALQRLAPFAALPRQATSEEVRLLAFRCLAAVLQPAPAGGGPGADAAEGSDADDLEAYAAALVAQQAPHPTPHLLSAESLAPLTGALIHSCLAAADDELAAGGLGSKAVRAAALEALRGLVCTIGDPDGLAFFLPGIASGLNKQLLASGGARGGAEVTGAAAGAAAAIQAIHGLVDALCIALGDASTAAIVAGDAGAAEALGVRGGSSAAGGQPLTVSSVEEALQQLSVAAACVDATPPAVAAASSSGGTGGSSVQQGSSMLATAPTGAKPRLRLERTPEWVVATASKVQTILAVSLPPQMTHPRPSVRQALAEGVIQLLSSCTVALRRCRQPLLELLLSLAQDEWPQVASTATAWLASHQGAAGPRSSPSPSASAAAFSAPPNSAPITGGGAGVGGGEAAGGAQQQLMELIGPLAAGLLPAVKAGEERGIMHARRLTTTLMYAGAECVAATLLQYPASLSQLVSSLVAAFSIEPTGASVLLHTRAPQGSYAQPAALLDGPLDEAASSAGGGAGSRSAAAPAAAGGARLQPPAAILLPRTPLMLTHLGSQRSYLAVAGVARCLGRLARAADMAGAAAAAAGQPGSSPAASNLQRLLDLALSAANRAAAAGQRGEQASASLGSCWQCEAAAAMAVATEIVFGASAAWQPPHGSSPSAAAPPGGGGGHAQQPAAAAADAGDELLPVLPLGAPDRPYAALVEQLLQQATRPQLWGLPTAQPEAPDAARLSAQVLGENVLLLRTLIDATGTAARCLGTSFQGPPLRCVLMPLLERLSDPCYLVADAADVSLRSICLHAGYAAAEAAGAGGAALLPFPISRANDLAGLGDAAAPSDGTESGAQLDAGRAGGASAAGADAASGQARPPEGGTSHAPAAAPAGELSTAYGLRALVAANADYIVDGVCRQLRTLGEHPRAPQLLAALLRKAGVGSQLLPLLAEPAGAALKGLSILARRQQPAHTLPFLAALLEVAAGAGAEGRAVETQVTARARQLQRAYDAQQAAAEERALREEGGQDDEHEPEATSHEEVEAYFRDLAARTQRDAEQPPGADFGEGGPPAEDEAAMAAAAAAHEASKLGLSEGEQEAWQLAYRSAYSAALLAGNAGEAAAPLLLSQQLKASIMAMEVCSVVLDALAGTTTALKTEEAVFEELARRPEEMRPVRPDAPKLLPAIHKLWEPLLACLAGDARPPVLERGLQLVAQAVRLGGGQFMTRKVVREAWPLLSKLLRLGPLGSTSGGGSGTVRRLGAPQPAATSQDLLALEQPPAAPAAAGAARTAGGDDDALAAASVQRVQAAAMACLEAVCCDEGAAQALQTIVWQVATSAVPFLADPQPLALREGAGKLLIALARVDADVVWLLLADLAGSCPGVGAGDVGPQIAHPELARQLGLKPLQQALGGKAGKAQQAGAAAGGGQQGFMVTLQLAAACGKRAAALLAQVEKQAPRWHQRAALPTHTL